MSEDNNFDSWKSMQETMKYLSVSREAILDWIANKNMPAYKIGRIWKFKFSEIDEWVRSGKASGDNPDERLPSKKKSAENKINE